MDKISQIKLSLISCNEYLLIAFISPQIYLLLYSNIVFISSTAATAAYNTPEQAPSAFTQSMPAAFRAEIPQPPPMNMVPGPIALNFAGGLPGGMPGPMFAPQPGRSPVFGAPQPGQFYRSMIPNYPFFNQMPGETLFS